MSLFVPLLHLVLLSISLLSHAEENARKPAEAELFGLSETERLQIQNLIKGLDSDEYKQRIDAQQKLYDFGIKGLDFLKHLHRQPDLGLEAKIRMERVIAVLQMQTQLLGAVRNQHRRFRDSEGNLIEISDAQLEYFRANNLEASEPIKYSREQFRIALESSERDILDSFRTTIRSSRQK